MIESVEIINFQAHEYTLLELHQGVNVIKGTSDHGKSSIIRALRWLILNRPMGFGFKSWFSNRDQDASVGIVFDDGRWVRRQRGEKGTNIYDIGEEYEALKGEVPETVKSILNLERENFQLQDDPYFLLSESPAEIARKLNEKVGLQIIDATVSEIRGTILEINRDLKKAKENTARLEEQVSELNYLDEVGVLIKDILAEHDTFLKQSRETKELEMALSKASLSTKQIDQADNILKNLTPLYTDLKKELHTYDTTEARLNELSWALVRIEEMRWRISESNKILEAKPLCDVLITEIERAELLLRETGRLDHACYQAETYSQWIEKQTEARKRAIEEYVELASSLEQCPLCLQTVDRANLSDHIRSYYG